MERETGIEPASLAWKARVLPLNYSRAALPIQLTPKSLTTQNTLYATHFYVITLRRPLAKIKTKSGG